MGLPVVDWSLIFLTVELRWIGLAVGCTSIDCTVGLVDRDGVGVCGVG
jgi:hypothetical protein